MLQHKYLSTIKRLKLFKGVKSFNDIQQQIEAHSALNKDRGDAFEVFAEAYLTLGLNAPYERVLPENKISKKYFDRLQIKSSDTNVKGIDGVLETNTKEFHTYQVKYRSHGEKLSWNDLAGSVAASVHADALLIFTNAIDIDDDISQRNVYSIKYDNLSSLGIDDFKRIEELIYKRKKKKRKKINLDPYQKDAIKAVLNHLRTNSRTQLIMPCGSGKTIVGQRIIESISEAKIILIIVPTLQLLHDTFENYYKDSSWDSFPYICVGSNVVDTKSYDQVDVDPSDLPIVTRTDPMPVKDFLSKNLSKNVIFSTYKSLPVVAEALGEKIIDVAIFDEAHNTASSIGGLNTFGLSNKNISIKKRIFMTATPRKYLIRRKNEEDLRISYSMDNVDVYGKVSYKLSFKKAADKYGAICRYKVVVSVISSDYYSREDLVNNNLLIGYNEVNAENIAKQIALTDSVEKNNISKIISFHPSINHAEEFVGDKNISIKNRLNDFDLYNVSSKQKIGMRRSNMRSFKSSSKALISNAQCLNEGIDVPSVDMVAFMHPKRSTVSIVQAIGRAIRKPRGSKKKIGYVFIPIFIQKSKNETIESAAEKTNFNDALEVLNALRDHDEVLDEIIKKLRIQKGSKGSVRTDNQLDRFLEIYGANIRLDSLKELIHSEIVNNLTSSWFEYYGNLKKYFEKHKTIHVPNGYKQNGLKLYDWIARQRTNKSLGRLEDSYIDLLEKLEYWTWDIYKSSWIFIFEQVKAKAQFDPYSFHLIKDFTLNRVNGTKVTAYKWIHTQRWKYTNEDEDLANYRQEMLMSIKNFVWEPVKESKAMLEKEIKLHFSEFNTYYVPPKFKSKSGYPLAEKITDYFGRAKFNLRKKGEIDSLLEEYPFYKLDRIEKSIEFISEYARDFGHLRPKNAQEKYKFVSILGVLNGVRKKYIEGKLSTESKNKLESLPYWSVDTSTDNWLLVYNVLLEYVKKHKVISLETKIKWSETSVPRPPFELKQNVTKDNKYVTIGQFCYTQRGNFVEYIKGRKIPSEKQKLKIAKMKKVWTILDTQNDLI